MKLTVRYFASIREAIGCGAETIETGARTVGDLRQALIARSASHAAALAPGKAVRIALDQVMAAEDALLREGAEVAFFPPVTGG